MSGPPPGLRPPPVMMPTTVNNFPNQQLPPRQPWNNSQPMIDASKLPPPAQPLASSVDMNSNGNLGNGENTSNGVAPDENKDKKPTEVILPKALEDVLALKDQRAAEFNVNSDEFNNVDGGGQLVNDYDAGDDSEEEGDFQTNGGIASKGGKLSKVEKNKKKKRRKKLNKKLKKQQEQNRDENKNDETAEEPEDVPAGSKNKSHVSDNSSNEKESKTKDKKNESIEREKSPAAATDVTIE